MMARRSGRFTAALALVAVVSVACQSGPDGGTDQAEDAGRAGAQRIRTVSGLEYEDLTVGTGASPQTGQVAVVHYTGWLADGKQFDSSRDRNRPFEFPVGRGRVIKGWDEGVATMKVGGKRKLWIPPELGYGAGGFGALIPPNADLVFEVELLDVK